ncbi:MAG TPA: hypothetical protein VFS98_09930 [Methylomirabilota bacterium]|nr:hypothetical protein [Methylomirabilota bacterium]
MRLDIGLMSFDLPAVPGYARRAEEMGFGAIWSAETRHDPVPAQRWLRPRPRGSASVPPSPSREGRSYRFDLTTPFFDRGPIEAPRIPIYLAGVNPHMCRIAGEVGDGLMADLITDEMLDLFGVSGRFEEIGAKIRERYRGLYDRTQLYPSFQPSLEDTRWRVVPAAFEPA